MYLYRKKGFYEKYVKRGIDITVSLLIVILFSWLYILIAILVRTKLGKPVLFVQYRPGLVDCKTGKEHIFKMYKFRTMTDKRDEQGNLLPDKERLTPFGAWLRSTSLDELPEVFNVLNNSMSLIGPRPQLVRDLVFMTREQRLRHTAKPGLSGLAQVRGRNAITWDEKLDYDIEYIHHISFFGDFRILFETIIKAFFKREGITEEGHVTAADYGDYLLLNQRITKEEYDEKQKEARRLLSEAKK